MNHEIQQTYLSLSLLMPWFPVAPYTLTCDRVSFSQKCQAIELLSCLTWPSPQRGEAVSYVCLSKQGWPAMKRINVCEWCFCLQMPDSDHNDPGSHTGVSANFLPSLSAVESLFQHWCVFQLKNAKYVSCVDVLLWDSICFFYHVNILIRIRIKSDYAPSRRGCNSAVLIDFVVNNWSTLLQLRNVPLSPSTDILRNKSKHDPFDLVAKSCLI